MSDETGIKCENAEDGDKVAKDETGVDTGTETKEPKETKSVSFNRDVHVKRFGKPRESRGASTEPTVRKEPFTHLSEQELIEEANKVRAQAEGITCTADHPPEKFFSLPHRRKFKEERERRNSEDGGSPEKGKTPLGRSTSDVSTRKGKERTSLSTLFRRQQRNKSPNAAHPVVVTTKPVAVVKRSKSDVSDLKSNTNLNTQTKPIRKRSGSETEEFLKSLRNKKTQLSPIIESSPRDDYFRKTPPLEVFQKQKEAKDSNKESEVEEKLNEKKVNPVEKPPRYKIPDKLEPKPPVRSRRSKSSEKDKEQSPPIVATPKRKTEIKKTLLVDEIDSKKPKEISPFEIKDRIKESIRKIEENIYADKEMIHSSQQPPDKPPLTRGHTVDHMVRILKEDQLCPPPKQHLITPEGGNNVNRPFSYIKPTASPDPNLFVRNTSPDRVPSPVNKMTDKGVVYAHVVRDNKDNGLNTLGKQTVHKTYSPSREKYGNISDEDEGLGYEERHKHTNIFDYDYKKENEPYNSFEEHKISDPPIRPMFREYKLTNFTDFEPTYANEYPTSKDKNDFIERGRADGMDTKFRLYETDNTRPDLDFNELSHRRQLLESRLKARRYEREREPGEPVSRYLAETDPIYEAEKRMKATEKYVNETAKYMHQTLERDGYTESSVMEDYNRYDSENHKVKYNTETRTFEKIRKGDVDRREFIDTLEPRYKDDKNFPPEPEYEPPSLEFNSEKPVLTPDEYKEKKYRAKKITSSHEVLQSGQKYKRDDYLNKRKGHYASNPEIAQERDDDYANIRYDPKQVETYHNSLRRTRNKDKFYKEDYGIRRHDSGDSRDYYREETPRRFEIDNRLVDSGIENDFRKDSGEIHRRIRRHESDDDVRDTSLFLASERRHTEDNYPSEQIYANGEYLARFKDYENGYRKEYTSLERSADDGSRFDPKSKHDKSPEDKVSAKPPKATKKLSGLEKMKQLFSRDSSKKSKKEKEVQPKARTRVLKSPEHLARDDSEYRRYTDPEPSDIEVVRKKDEYVVGAGEDERRFKSSREDLDRRRSPRGEEIRISPRNEEIRRLSPRNEEIRRISPRDEEIRRISPREEVIRNISPRDDKIRRISPRDEDIRQISPRDEEIRRFSPRDEVDRFRSHRIEDEEGRRRISPKDEIERLRNLREDLEIQRSPVDGFERYRDELGRQRGSREDIDRYRSSREDLDKYRNAKQDQRYRGSDHRDSDIERKYRETDLDARYERTIKEKRFVERKEEKRRYYSSDRDSDLQRGSDLESDRRLTRARTTGPLDSPALAERYRERRRLATPSPTPSPPRRQPAPLPPPTTAGNWFKSLDRLTKKKRATKDSKIEKESVLTEDDLPRKTWKKPLNSPAKNLRFFGDTDQDSDVNTKQPITKSKSNPTHGTLRKTTSNSSAGLDEVDHETKTYPLSNPKDRDSLRTKQYYKRNLQNISEVQSNSEAGSHLERKALKPPIDRSRSHSSTKTLKGSKGDLRKRAEERGSSSELRGSKPELRDLKHRRRTPAAHSGESSTEGDSSHQSQRSVVYLHATTVGDIPDPGRLARNRSRDDVSSVNSSNLHTKSTTKSFSIFAPWTPKHYNDQQDVHYAQRQRKTKPKETTFKKSSSTKNLSEDRPATLQKKSYSQTTLTRKPRENRWTGSSSTLYRKPEKRESRSVVRDGKKSQSSEMLNRENERDRLSRSVSMPKDSKKAGWFKLSNKKKQENNTRVR